METIEILPASNSFSFTLNERKQKNEEWIELTETIEQNVREKTVIREVMLNKTKLFLQKKQIVKKSMRAFNNDKKTTHVHS